MQLGIFTGAFRSIPSVTSVAVGLNLLLEVPALAHPGHSVVESGVAHYLADATHFSPVSLTAWGFAVLAVAGLFRLKKAIKSALAGRQTATV